MDVDVVASASSNRARLDSGSIELCSSRERLPNDPILLLQQAIIAPTDNTVIVDNKIVETVTMNSSMCLLVGFVLLACGAAYRKMEKALYRI